MLDLSSAGPRGPVRPGRVRRGGGLLLGLLLGAFAGCAPHPPATPAPTARLESTVRDVRGKTRLDGPRRIVFSWELNESGSRMHGRGVARVQPPYQARLDLFTENGETAARAALVESRLRVPPGVDRRLVPPPPLLWTALGVFHPGAGAELLDGTLEGNDGLRARYRLEGDVELVYDLAARTIRSAEIQRDGHAVERVRLEWDERTGFPEQAVYRDLAAFRELKVKTESVERAEPYPPEVFDP